MSPHSSREPSSHEPAPRQSASRPSGSRLSTSHAVTSPTARFRKPAQPLAARYTDPAPRSLRPVEEPDFAPRIGERILFTGASGLLGRESVLALLRAGYDVRVFSVAIRVLRRFCPIRFARVLSRCAAILRTRRRWLWR